MSAPEPAPFPYDPYSPEAAALISVQWRFIVRVMHAAQPDWDEPAKRIVRLNKRTGRLVHAPHDFKDDPRRWALVVLPESSPSSRPRIGVMAYERVDGADLWTVYDEIGGVVQRGRDAGVEAPPDGGARWN